MEVENDTDYKKTKLTSLNFYHKLKPFVLAISISTSLFTGKEIVRASDNIYSGYTMSNCENNEENYIDIPDVYKENLNDMFNSKQKLVTKKDLNRVKSFNLTISDESDITWLRYCSNLEKLYVIVDGDADSSVLNGLEVLNELKDFNELYLGTVNNLALTKDKTTFLSRTPNIKKLTIDGFSVEEGVLEELTNLEKLSLNVSSKGVHARHINVDYQKLTFLKELNFYKTRPYDIAIWFTTGDYKALVDNGVSITTDNKEDLEKIITIDKQLDEIISSLELDSLSEKAKYDKILSYVLVRLHYDKLVSETDTIDVEEIENNFYLGGQLYGALEDRSAICGNYASLLSALLNRVDIESYYITSYVHAWNLIKIGGKYYYVDATVLDDKSINVKQRGIFISKEEIRLSKGVKMSAPEVIGLGYGELFDWYLEDPNDYHPYKVYYDAINIPEYVNLSNYEKSGEKIKNYTNKNAGVCYGEF